MTMTITKEHMARFLFRKASISKSDAGQLVDLFFTQMRESLAAGNSLRLSGFGNFNVRDKNERVGRNPRTGENVPITARRVVSFRAGQKLKDRLDA